jgi:pyruvate ferredoxin oxidoreductase alpha subunit
MNRQYVSGCTAVAMAVSLSEADVVAAYPITPQTSIVESLASKIAAGELRAQMVHVESEHSAMSVCVGAACVGARPFTASCGQGLAYMKEPVFWAAGLRLPIVMAITNRSLLGPNTIFCDHQDSISTRDSGWLQLYAETCQEVLDSVILGYRIAEDARVQLPVMVCLDGFFLSHLNEAVEVPEQDQVRAFLPKLRGQRPVLDPADPKLLNVLVPPDYYTEFEFDKHHSMLQAAGCMDEVFEAFGKQFGRRYARVEPYDVEDADIVLVAMGSMAGTIRAVVRALRAEGRKVGLLKIRSFRPFPHAEVAEALAHARAVGVLDRSISYGSTGALYQEVVRCLYSHASSALAMDFVVGLGGRDVSSSTVRRAADACQAALAAGKVEREVQWPDARKDLLRTWGWES